ncbi:hypothetical protein [Streptomyces sp. NPDC004065]|uniref:hypothetical protein n=1 Tax=Streptomyces sp. NPDC004065 TaxID=3364689 RepID=UPI00384EBC9F
MHSLEHLISLPLRRLAEALESCVPAEADLEPAQWLSVVELLTMRLDQGFVDLPTEYQRTCSAAFTRTLNNAVAVGAIDHHESVVRRLNLSLILLRRVPPSDQLEMLDSERLLSLLLREVPLSIEEARILSSDWRTRDIAEIRTLRRAKNLLSPGLAIAKLVSAEKMEPELKAWEQIFPMLP